MYVRMYVCMHGWMLKMPEWLGISDMSDVSHTLAKWVCFSSILVAFSSHHQGTVAV